MPLADLQKAAGVQVEGPGLAVALSRPSTTPAIAPPPEAPVVHAGAEGDGAAAVDVERAGRARLIVAKDGVVCILSESTRNVEHPVVTRHILADDHAPGAVVGEHRPAIYVDRSGARPAAGLQISAPGNARRPVHIQDGSRVGDDISARRVGGGGADAKRPAGDQVLLLCVLVPFKVRMPAPDFVMPPVLVRFPERVSSVA